MIENLALTDINNKVHLLKRVFQPILIKKIDDSALNKYLWILNMILIKDLELWR